MPPLLVRHLEPPDLPQVQALFAETSAYADTLQLPFRPLAHWQQKFGAPRDGQTWLVAVRDAEVLGQLTLEVATSPRRRHVATLGMGVRAGARRSGVGSALLAAAIDLGERWLQVSRIEIEVYAGNDAAMALYQKHGFALEGTCRNYAFRDGRLVDVHRLARLRPDEYPRCPT